ncbi:MAG: BlaI/MecI/CopY family transcriptional regulator [Planctomycetota bacterium]
MMTRRNTAKEPKVLSPAEWKVMSIVWERKEGAARDIYSVAGERYGWAVATVKTLLRRLVDKGYLTTKRIGNSYLYRPDRSAVTTLSGAAETLLGYAIEGSIGPVLMNLVKKSRLSSEEISELRQLLDEMAPEAQTGEEG